MIKAAVVGATGYAGEELLKILVNHQQVSITSVSAKIEKPQRIDEIYPYLSQKCDLVCQEPDFSEIVSNCDIAFLALPHRLSMEIAPLFLKAQKKVIDLSADYRLKNKIVYEKWYGIKHKSVQYLKQAVYGLPELYRAQIAKAQLVANPGCFPTGIILGSLPLLVKHNDAVLSIIADAKTGLSGAGREKEATLIPELKNNFRAYKVDQHQHAPEIEQELNNVAGKDTKLVFVPHLIPIQRGILSTLYIKLKKRISDEDIYALYQDVYKEEPFIKILTRGIFPQLKDVSGTNYCHIGLALNQEKRLAIVITAIDNLVKGASGQAVQNMNIMFGFKETEGLL